MLVSGLVYRHNVTISGHRDRQYDRENLDSEPSKRGLCKDVTTVYLEFVSLCIIVGHSNYDSLGIILPFKPRLYNYTLGCWAELKPEVN